MRRAVLILAGLETVLWLYLTIGARTGTLIFAKGNGGSVAVASLALLVFVLFVLPALILGAVGRGLGVAALLAVIGALAYGFDPWLRALTLFDATSAQGLYGLAVVAVLVAGCFEVLRAAIRR